MRSFSSDLEGQARRSKVREFLTKKWERTHLSASFWNKMIVISCVIAISLDPLFLYIPFIDEEKKCLGMDKKLRNVALILRSLTDITFLVDIGYPIYEGIKEAYKEINQGKARWELDWQATLIRRDEIVPFAVILARELKWCSSVIDLLSVFPLPQLLVVKFFFKMRGSGYFEWRKLVNLFLFGQYLSRIYRIFISYKKVTRSIAIWVKVLFNLFLYLLASHVLGAFWYFFSIQRETFCWHQACDNHEDREGCMSTIYCDDDLNTSTTDIIFFNEFCGIDVPDNTKPPFNYGIFLDSLKIGNTGHVHFPTKLCYSFWWGLRNLSNFGTNLITSNYVWENLFAILISITGSLLFIFLVGNNVETFIHVTATKREESKRKADLRNEKIDTWMKKYHISDDMREEIMKTVNKHWEEDKDVDLENLFNVLPGYIKKDLKHFLCFRILSRVKLLQFINENVLTMMCDCLTPVTYKASQMIFPEGGPIDRMLLIIDGTVFTYSNSSSAGREETTEDSGVPSQKDKEGPGKSVYGEKLLTWASPNKSGYEVLPRWTENVKCHTKVEGFTLSAQDMLRVVSKHERWWKLNL